MFKNYFFLLVLLGSVMAQAQKLKVEWVAGDVSLTKKGQDAGVKLKKNDVIEIADKVYLGEKALLVVSDYSKKLFEVKKKGYVSGRELSEGLVKTADNEYQRYLAYILKDLKNHESEMKSNEKGIPGAPSRGEEFRILLPDTIQIFNNEQIPVFWENSVNTEVTNIQLQNDKKSLLMDVEVNGTLFWLNNLAAYFTAMKQLNLSVYELRTDGNKVLKARTVIKKSTLKQEVIKKEIEAEFTVFQDERLKGIAIATKWEINQYYLQALSTYKILLLDFPDDEMVKTSFESFTQRTGLR